MSSNVNLFQLKDKQVYNSPFDFFKIESILNPSTAQNLLSWFKNTQWNLVETDFYEQYEFSLWDKLNEIPVNLNFLCQQTHLNLICEAFEKTFNCKLSREKIDLVAHKLVHGQKIKIHNDYIPNQETHRLVIQINDGWKEEYGGFLMLFNGNDARSLADIIIPVNNSAFGFCISKNSHHAVSTVHDGERYTLIYSFYSV